MLAEHEGPGFFMEKGFDMNYAWEMHHLMKNVAQGKDSSYAISGYFAKELNTYPQNVYRLMFLTNHDENSWAGTVDTLFGPSQKAFATLIFTSRGVPLLYSGQETCLNKRLRFFVRDTIKWHSCEMTGFYSDLIKMRKENKALWNGEFGGTMSILKTNMDKKVFAFCREKEDNRVLVFLNLSKKPVKLKAVLKGLDGEYTEYFTKENLAVSRKTAMKLEPWGYKVYIK